MNKYIAFDLETGGLEPEKVSVLTGYFAVLDEKLNITMELYLQTAPKSGIYQVTAQALEINNIDLIEHDRDAITEEAGGTELFNFLKEASGNGKTKLVPIGQNVNYDIDCVFAKFMSKNSWEQFVSYRKLDTAGAAEFLKAAGLLPESISGSLGSLVEHYNVPREVAHTAYGDTKMTINVLKEMLDVIAFGN